jgi:ADP-ribose pyrophosphatase
MGLGPSAHRPGFARRFYTLFLATGLHEGLSQPDEGEFLSVEKWPLDELVDQIMAGIICDAKTIAAVFKARECLKNEPGGIICE